ncbi:LOW QUALITY PROTEIN: uncharacterized protein LOC119579451 [Penaeus monodon]|uniref:LOW QUALITY PROTEIN: uncharacterized protein LOC119579451 n=1 Tax=Penaeus monodon TaxID=6687 RepID=UPI0018A7045B|nr:LOW QUALITY PROTEIN: uncharacterized protein LOC119579451 [Penaeus monodon]
MESPTPRLSESNLKKLSRGLRSSKKSLHSVHSALETHSVQDGQLSGRSVSLSTLLPSGGPGGMRPRVDKLQTLEAKMASIEVSLGWKRRREALLETLPRAARDLVRELDTLHQALKDKDTVIQSLKTQITNLGGTVGGGSDLGGVLSEAERRSIQERLNKVQAEMDAKKVAIKNLKLALEKIDITDNIDVRIHAAELEYELEREELNVLNLKEESSVLGARLQENSPSSASGAPGSQTTLHTLISSAGGAAALSGASLTNISINHTPGNPDFHVTPQTPYGCVIDWATEETRLRKGDRLLEVNGECVVGRGLDLVTRLMASATHLNLVVARPNSGTGARKSEVRLEKQLEDRAKEVKDLVSRLDKALKDKETLKSDNTRLNHRISYLEDQVSELQATLNHTREVALKHSDGEAIVTTSQPGATVIQVFQKGDQKLAVAGHEISNGVERAEQYPTLPRLRSPNSSVSSYPSTSSDPHTNHSHGYTISSRPSSAAETRRRVLSPRPDSKNEDSRPPSRTKPKPPKKPERLSLQRTTSLQSVDEGMSTSHSSSRYNTLHNWPSLDTDLNDKDYDLQSQTIYEQNSERPDDRLQDRSCSRYQGRYHHRSRDRKMEQYSSSPNSEGSVWMVVNGSLPSVEKLSRRPSPQGAASTSVHEGYPTHSPLRPHSPDAAVHLEADHTRSRDLDVPENETYCHSGVSAVPPYGNHYHHGHSHQHHYTHHKQHSLQSPHKSPTRSSALSVATSPRPHEQWC